MESENNATNGKLQWIGSNYQEFVNFANTHGYSIEKTEFLNLYLKKGDESLYVVDGEWLVWEGESIKIVQDNEIDYMKAREARERYRMGYCERLC